MIRKVKCLDCGFVALFTNKPDADEVEADHVMRHGCTQIENTAPFKGLRIASNKWFEVADKLFEELRSESVRNPRTAPGERDKER